MSDNRMETYPLFSKLVGVAALNLSNKDLKKAQTLLKKYKLRQANLNETYSSVSKKILEDKTMNFLARAIDTQFQKYTREFMQYLNSFKLTTSWVAKVQPGAKSHEHNHRNSMISGVAYIQSPPNAGNITFYQKNLDLFDIPFNTMNIFNSPAYSFEPKANTVLFFPSDLYHEVEKNTSKEDRYSVGMNWLPIGEVGTPGTDSGITLL